jgi:hypothetical protein
MPFSKDSRYRTTAEFRPPEDGSPGFPGTRARDVPRATGVLEHTVADGDRIDLLALHYYNDDRMWWRILDANPHILHGGDLTLGAYTGSILVIPRPTER